MDSYGQSSVNYLKIGDRAPDFYATTTFGPIQFSDYTGKWVILFSHPGSFTPVCTTEFLAFAKTYPMFQNLNAELIGLNIDSNASNLAWVDYIYQSNDVMIPFPVIADRMGIIARLYGMIPADDTLSSPVRDVFIIDPSQVIRGILIYPSNVGRNINEIMRFLNALQVSDRYNVLTPANWVANNPVILPAPATYDDLLEREEMTEDSDITCLGPFWCYKDLPPI